MSSYPMEKGKAILEYTFLAGTGGVYRWRGVITDSASPTTPVSERDRFRVKLPSTAFTAGENFVGIVQGPSSTLDGTEALITAGKTVNVRLQGFGPMQCDTNVGSTAIAFGDYVALSAGASGDEGKVRKATRSSNTFAANQHVVGVSLNRCTLAVHYSMVLLRPMEL
jgi:hypothetical protein